MIVLSLMTMQSLSSEVRTALAVGDMLIGLAFALEYALRIYKAQDRRAYIFSFWGIIDFIAIVPSLFIGGIDLRTMRAIRLLRLTRLLKLYRTSAAMQRLLRAFEAVRYEFIAYALLSLLIFFIASVGIYAFENQAQPDVFPSIPAAMWWAVATLTTVGYGDVYPITVAGRIFTTIILLVGLGLVAVPTGLIASALQNDPSEAPSSPEDSDSTSQGEQPLP